MTKSWSICSSCKKETDSDAMVQWETMVYGKLPTITTWVCPECEAKYSPAPNLEQEISRYERLFEKAIARSLKKNKLAASQSNIYDMALGAEQIMAGGGTPDWDDIARGLKKKRRRK